MEAVAHIGDLKFGTQCRSVHISNQIANLQSHRIRAPILVRDFQSALQSLIAPRFAPLINEQLKGVPSRRKGQTLLCEALWGRNRQRRQDPRIRIPPQPDPRQAPPPPNTDAQQDSPYSTPPPNRPRQNPENWGPPPNAPPPPDQPFEEDGYSSGRDWRARRGPQREVTREELLEQSRRIRARIRQIKRQRRAAYYGEVGEGFSFITSGLNPEMINGRCAMVGFVAALFNELTTGRSVWEQLTYQGGLQVMLIPLTIVVIMLSSYAPGANEMEDDGLTRPSKPFGPFNSFAERVNGRFAMLGFVSLIIIEALTGEALFKIGWLQ
ncbi:early light-induced protein [Klebsormidium nitens]|uniref:Early light-induced protein n=1 Tax=Klebsormidium nitens TaxID=105231 RepID=A0A1Y1HQJ7_KLENI|nr:early light-induced protein [Klebsormidium nitens]|eukprot:GAQ80353.1 early light-induced protein [Klebsormidium nitens]